MMNSVDCLHAYLTDSTSYRREPRFQEQVGTLLRRLKRLVNESSRMSDTQAFEFLDGLLDEFEKKNDLELSPERIEVIAGYLNGCK